MSAGIVKLPCDQGATFQLALTYRNPDQTPVDLTDYTAEMRVAANKGGALVLHPTTTNGQIFLSDGEYNVLVTVPADVTALLIPGQFVHELDLTSPSGIVIRLIEGSFPIDAKV